MIIEYLQPETLAEAVNLLRRKNPVTLPLGGGSVLSKYQANQIAVVDLQNLHLNQIRRENGIVQVGATATLSELEEFFKSSEIAKIIRLQTGRNQRNLGTIAGLINVADGRSPLLTFLLALDAQLDWQPEDVTISLADWLPQRRSWHESLLITQVSIPEVPIIRFESVGRTPKDRPIVAIAIAKWPTDRLRISVGGFGAVPVLAFDGDIHDDFTSAVDQVYAQAEDQWASAVYRCETGRKLAMRLVEEIMNESETRAK